MPAGIHAITVEVEGSVVGGWSGYHFSSSMITLADSFELRRPFDAASYVLLRRGARVKIKIDGVTMMDGFVGKRRKGSRDGTFTINGRDRCGRVVDETAPAINYTGMTIKAAVEALVSPWFSRVTLTDARNRLLRRGHGKRLPSGKEPVVPIALRVPRQGVVHPGQTRGQVIHEICARAGLVAYASADGQEFFIGRPNHDQSPQYLFVQAAQGSKTKGTVRDLVIEEDDEERYSSIMVSGTGGQGDTNYGENVVDARGIVFDNPFNRIDGTGRDFIYPKRMAMPEKNFDSFGDAQRVAENEQFRRDFRRHVVTVECDHHGQFLETSEVTLFAPNTVARVIDEEAQIDDTYLIVSCSYSGSRDQAETTSMELVPTGTEIIL